MENVYNGNLTKKMIKKCEKPADGDDVIDLKFEFFFIK